MRHKSLSFGVAVLIILPGAYGQGFQDPHADIAKLMSDFQFGVVSGGPVDQFFSPAARVRDRQDIDALRAKPFLKFAFKDYNLPKGLKLIDAKHATLEATVEWKTRGEMASRTCLLRFEEAEGSWYFSDASFWVLWFGWLLPIYLLVGVYGCSVIIMYVHSARQRWFSPKKKSLWRFLAIIPLSPLFYFSGKPWKTP